MSYNRYPMEMKEAIVARLLEEDVVVMDIQKETGVGINTLYRWRDEAMNKRGLSATTKYKNADKWSSQDKVTVVLETRTLVADPITKMLQMDGNEKLLINEKGN